MKEMGLQMLDDSAKSPPNGFAALRGGSRLAAVDDGVLQVAQQFPKAHLLLIIHLIGQTDGAGGQVCTADLNGMRENLRPVASALPAGKSGLRAFGAFQCRIAENVDDLVGGRGFRTGAGIAANHRNRIAGNLRNEHQFFFAFHLNLVADAEAAAVVYNQFRIAQRIQQRLSRQGVLIRQKGILKPFVPCAGCTAGRIAQCIQQRSFKRRNDADQIRDIFRQFRQSRAGAVGCFSGKCHR